MTTTWEEHNLLMQEFHELEECNHFQGSQLLNRKEQHMKDVVT
jgi:hypothetical protein